MVRKQRHPRQGDERWRNLVSRFQAGLVQLESGCWICETAEPFSKGYTRLTVNRKPFGQYRISTHVLSYWLHKGARPNGLCVCHSCDNPPCCNPDHLFLGTQLDNAQDREAKGRGRFGDNHPNAKLTSAQVLDIHRQWQAATPQQEIAAQYGITQAAVSGIVTGKLWPQLHPAPARIRRKPILKRKQMKCTVPGCPSLSRKRGMCVRHFRRWSKTGSTALPVALDANKPLRDILVRKFLAGLTAEPSGCWTCSTADYSHDSGYGRVGVQRVGRGSLRSYAHILSYQHFRGSIPKGLLVCHDCDNRRCCNPDHLSLGTQAVNLDGMVRRGRSRTGERHHAVKLSEAQVMAIRQLAGTTSQRAIAARYGITQPHVSALIRGKSWKHLRTAQE